MNSRSDHADPRELQDKVLALGDQALALLRQSTRGKMPPSQLQNALRQLEAGRVMARFWPLLTTDPALADCFAVLQSVNSLEDSDEYQVEQYGASSLWDDLQELQSAVRRVRGRGGPMPQSGDAAP